MKKLIISLLLVILLVAGCTSPEPATKPPVVQQPTEQVVVSTTKPTTEPTVVTTEEPTVEPTETEKVVPEEQSCGPSKSEIATPEELLIDLSLYGGEVIKPIEIGSSFVLHEPESLMEDGGALSFSMPSLGLVYLHEETTLTINGKTWERYGALAVSPEGDFLVQKGTLIEIVTTGKIEFPEAMMSITLLSGEAIPAEDILLPIPEGISYKIRCNSLGIWEISIKNTSGEDLEIMFEKNHQYMIMYPDGVKKIKFSWGEIPEEQVRTGHLLSQGDALILLPNGSIKVVVVDLFYDNE